MTTLTHDEQQLLGDLLDGALQSGGFPEIQAFRVANETRRDVIDQLEGTGFLRRHDARYVPTLKGIRELDTPESRAFLEACNRVLSALQKSYRMDPARRWSDDVIAPLSGVPLDRFRSALVVLSELAALGWGTDAHGAISQIAITESVLDADPIVSSRAESHESSTSERTAGRLRSIEISGYRALDGFSASPGDLTVIIGANASGKSSLFDLLSLVAWLTVNPLPPEIDPWSVGRRLFHSGGPEQLSYALVMDFGVGVPLRYEVVIQGPIGSPTVSRERLATIEPPFPGASRPLVHLDFQAGKGLVRYEAEFQRKRWQIPPNELALRRALDPALVTAGRVNRFIGGWHFYRGLDVGPVASIRRPATTETDPTLFEDGRNLTAVLFSIQSEHPDRWQELETHLRSAVPGFESLTVKARGGPGMMIGVWRERGVKDELTLADLSDGTLRFLCWAAICLRPSPPPLLCIDEPELGLHPRVLPVLAGLLRLASARSQILVTTHSPYFLSHFALDEIAVMRKEAGRAVFVRPADSAALRHEVEELGGAAIAQLHLSEELETLS